MYKGCDNIQKYNSKIPPYLIEIRLFGKVKYEFKQLIRIVSRRLNISIRHPVPHITLLGPFDTKDERQLMNDFKSVCSNFNLMQYELGDIGIFTDTRVVYVDVTPSVELVQFRTRLQQVLAPYCTLSARDLASPFVFHATLVSGVYPNKILDIQQYAAENHTSYKHQMIRVTLLKSGKIIREYDFALRQMLDCDDAMNRALYVKTINTMRDKLATNDNTVD
ncbi:MAG: 2'-5' RNA ligase family protein [Methanogenium sp.]|jgi:2'-5' RNA ligase